MKESKCIARLTFHEADMLPNSDLRKIAAWLRKQASSLLKDHARYSKRFTARYYES